MRIEKYASFFCYVMHQLSAKLWVLIRPSEPTSAPAIPSTCSPPIIAENYVVRMRILLMQIRGTVWQLLMSASRLSAVRLLDYKKFILGLTLTVVAGFIGCRQSTIAPATPRSGGSPAIVATSGATPDGGLVTNNDTPASNFLDRILHQELFAALACEFADIRNAKEFSTLPWADLEKTWQNWIGMPNQSLTSVTQWWVLVDRNGLSVMPSSAEEPKLPFVQVLVFDQPVDRETLAGSWLNPKSSPGTSIEFNQIYSKSDSSMVVLDERSIAYGDSAALERMLAATPSSKMKTYWSTSPPPDDTFRARFEMSAIRAQIKPLFEMAAQFGGNNSWSKLPDVLTELQLTGHMDHDPLLQIDLLIEDETLQKDLGQWLTQQFQNASQISSLGNSPSIPGLPAMDQMFEAESAKVLPKLAEEIQRDRLLEVVSLNQRLQVTLKRPKQFSNALSAMILDANRQRLIVARIQAAERIGSAIRKYRDSHQKFPSRAAILESIADSTVPRQFSWRVAILPELGYQELYDQFDFSQAWDSEHNLMVAKKLPEDFPLADANGNSTWLLPLNAQSLFSTERIQPNQESVQDRRIWTAAVLEAATDRSVFWTNPMEPESDLDKSLEQWGKPDEKGVIIINADGQTRVIRRQAELIKAVLTIAGGETLTRKDFLQVQPASRNPD